MKRFLFPKAFMTDLRRVSASVDAALRSLPRGVPGSCQRDRLDAASRLAGRVGSKPPSLFSGFKRCGGPRCVRKSTQRTRTKHPVVPRWFRRSRTVEQDDFDIPRSPRFEPGQSSWEKSALRHTRTCNGCDHERPVALETSSLRRDISHIQRLRPARTPSCRDYGTAGYFHIYT